MEIHTNVRRVVRTAIVVGVAAALVGSMTVGAGAGSSKTVRTMGDESFVPNAKISVSTRFSPGPLTVKSGDTVTWVHGDATPAPHTVTILNASEVPATIDELFECDVCFELAGGHFAGGLTPVLNQGAPGLDARGDSLLFFDDGQISAAVTAPAGTTLSYLCAFHPWMQGTIKVV